MTEGLAQQEGKAHLCFGVVSSVRAARQEGTYRNGKISAPAPSDHWSADVEFMKMTCKPTKGGKKISRFHSFTSTDGALTSAGPLNQPAPNTALRGNQGFNDQFLLKHLLKLVGELSAVKLEPSV